MRLIFRLFFAVMMIIAGLTTQLPKISAPPSQTNYSLDIDSRFSRRDRQIIIEALSEYQRFGIYFWPTTETQSVDLHIKQWFNITNARIGECHPNLATVFLDAERTETDIQLRALTIHEVGHFLGMNHICEYPTESYDCSPTLYGPAIMNPFLLPNHIIHFSSLDIIEFNRARRIYASVPHIR